MTPEAITNLVYDNVDIPHEITNKSSPHAGNDDYFSECIYNRIPIDGYLIVNQVDFHRNISQMC